MFLRTQFWKSLLNYFEQKHGKVESLKITSAILSKLKGVYLFFLATVKLKLNKGFFNQRLILVLKNIFQCEVMECYLHLTKLKCRTLEGNRSTLTMQLHNSRYI